MLKLLLPLGNKLLMTPLMKRKLLEKLSLVHSLHVSLLE